MADNAKKTGEKLNPKLFPEWGEIENDHQNMTYMEELQNSIREFEELQSKIILVTQQFSELKRALEAETPANGIQTAKSKEYYEIQGQIYQFAEELKNDQEKQAIIKRFNYLNEKLPHLKQRLQEYTVVKPK